jgi:hypothetical protein
MKLLAFDVETDNIPSEGIWALQNPLRVYCAATVAWDGEKAEELVWYGGDSDVCSERADEMTAFDCNAFLVYLIGMMTDGYTPVSFNGTQFDLPVMAMASGDWEMARAIGLPHFDMFLEMVARKGFGCKLSKAAEAIGAEKLMSGEQVEIAWSVPEERQKVLDYVLSDARITLDVALKALQSGAFKWVTGKGSTSSWPLDGQFATVRECMEFSPPDTSWMTSGPRFDMEQMTAWLLEDGASWTPVFSSDDEPAEEVALDQVIECVGSLIDYSLKREGNTEWESLLIKKQDGTFVWVNLSWFSNPEYAPLCELWSAFSEPMGAAEMGRRLREVMPELFTESAPEWATSLDDL